MKKINANLWSQAPCNRLVQQRIEERRQREHIRAIRETKKMVDATAPEEQAHLKSKSKKKQLEEDRAADIQLENRILLQKMLNIDTKASQFGPEIASTRMQPRSLNGEAQRRELDRIAGGNQELLRRLQHAKPTMDMSRLEDDEMDRQALKFRISQNSYRGRTARLRMPEKSCCDGSLMLPTLDGKDDWARIQNSELDKQLRELDEVQNAVTAGPAS